MKSTDRWRFQVTSKEGEELFYVCGEGPVELMTEACKAAGVVWKKEYKEGDVLSAFDGPPGSMPVWREAVPGIYSGGRLVIPAPPPEPCPNCQNAKSFQSISKSGMLKHGQWSCYVCDRPESEWTYAKDDPGERGEIGVGI